MLTREQAYEIIANYEYIMFGCNYGTVAGRELIDQIFHEHEIQLKAKDEEIKALVEKILSIEKKPTKPQKPTKPINVCGNSCKSGFLC